MISKLARSTFLRVLAVSALALLGLLPIANWIQGGHEADWYAQVASEWLSGSAIAVGLGLVLAILSRRLPLWRTGLGEALALRAVGRPHRTGLVLGVVAFSLYATIAYAVFDARPLLIDELVQVIQARIFASGRLTLPAPANPEFFSILHMVDMGGRWYSQFPPGGPFVLMLGVLVGAVWLVGPVCGALAVVAFWYLMQRLDDRPTVVLGASVLFTLAPFMAFMAGSHMNSVPTLLFGVVALLAAAEWSSRVNGSLRLAVVLGLALGAMAAVRPVDGAAYAAPIGFLLLWAALRNSARLPDLLAAGVGVAIPVGLVLFYNSRTTGDPLLFGYELLWGKSHALGFHRAPWGFAHTPARGLELINIYFLRLQSYLFESSVPSLLPALGAMAIGSRLSRADRLILWSSGLLLIGYFAYWHDGFYLGPRFLFPLMPLLALWSARFVAELRRVTGTGSPPVRVAAFSLGTAGLMGLCFSVPVRVKQYEGGLASMRLDYTAPARESKVANALIFVRESWGTQLVARLWALGVPRTEAEALYRGVDSCVLEHAIIDVERSQVRDSAAMRALIPWLRDSSRVVKTELSPDRTERMLPGAKYSSLCLTRIAEDRQGFTLLAPLHALDQGSNIYVRDLHARDSLMLAQHPSRPLFLLRPVNNEIGASLELKPISIDSLVRAWRQETSVGGPRFDLP